MIYNILDTPTFEEFGDNYNTVIELSRSARKLNRVIGKRSMDELMIIALDEIQDQHAHEILNAVIGDELAGTGGSFALPQRTDGLINRLHVQIIRLRK